LKTRDAGLGGGSVADVLIKALTGDPEREMALARARSAIDTDAYQQRQIQAATEKLQAETLARQAETDARVGSVPAAAQLAYDNLPEPVPVAIPTPAPAPRPAAFSPGSDFSDGDYDPAPVADEIDPVYGPATATGDWLPAGAPAPVAQPMPGDVIDARPPIEQIEKLMAAGAWTADPMGQYGKGAGLVGTVYGEGTPEEQARNNLLYANKTAGETKAASTEAALKVRKQLEGLPAYGDLADVMPVYDSMLKSSQLDTKAANMDMIYGIATLEDPGSVVREADSLMVQRTGGLSGEVQSMLSYFTENGSLTPEMRANLMRIASNRVGAYRKAFDEQAEQYRGIAERAGLDIRDVVPTFSDTGDYTQPLPPEATAAGYTEDYITQEMQRTGLSRDAIIEAIRQRLTAGNGR